MNNLEKIIISTLKYHDEFAYPLTKQEIFRFLVLNSKFKIQNSKLQLKIKNALNQLIKKKEIGEIEDFYYVLGREKFVEIRKKREKYSKEKIKTGKRIIQLFKFIPWITMVGITGALAMNNAKKDDDIDLMIITEENRLWMTRLLLIFILDVLGKRRKPNDKQVKDKLCLNLFLDEESLKLKKEKQNLFTAHEIVQMKPVFNKDNTYEKFLRANEWVKDFLPNSLDIKILGYKDTKKKNKKLQNISISKYLNICLGFLENFSYNIQLGYMQNKKTSEQISKHFAFFHPLNRIKNE